MILGYIRVSTLDQTKGISPEEQERVIRGFAQMRGASSFDLQLYSDPGISGAMPLSERPAGKRLLADVSRGDTIVASKFDRLFRSAPDALANAECWRIAGIDLVLADMGIEPVTGNGAGKLFFGMLAVFAEFERERIAERMQEGKRGKKARNNGHIGGLAPYGFKVVGSGREARLEPDTHEQEVIRVASALWKKQPPAAVVRELTRRELVSRTGVPFQIVQVRRFVERAGV